MSRRKRLSYEEKLRACKLYERGFGSKETIAKQINMSYSGFYNIYYKYENYGPKGLKMKVKNRSYTRNFKEKMIREYNTGNYSYLDLAKKYNITNPYVITRWVLGYNSSNKNTYGGESGVTMKGRKTTLEERIEIIGYLIDNDIDYKNASFRFKVSYQQVYSWYKKYEEAGIDGLVDKRGRKKQTYELSEIDLLKRENARLKKELKLSRAAEEVLKKNEN